MYRLRDYNLSGFAYLRLSAMKDLAMCYIFKDLIHFVP